MGFGGVGEGVGLWLWWGGGCGMKIGRDWDGWSGVTGCLRGVGMGWDGAEGVGRSLDRGEEGGGRRIEQEVREVWHWDMLIRVVYLHYYAELKSVSRVRKGFLF